MIHTPGHTPGSISLYTPGKVFTGDTLFRRGIGTTLMPGSSRSQLINSILTKLMKLPDNTIIYTGHGRETTIGAERRITRMRTAGGKTTGKNRLISYLPLIAYLLCLPFTFVTFVLFLSDFVTSVNLQLYSFIQNNR